MAEINDLEISPNPANPRWTEGQLPSSVNDGGRETENITARWYQDNKGDKLAGGTADALTMATDQTLLALYDGLDLAVKIQFNNTGPATFNPAALGAKKILFNGVTELAADDLVADMKMRFIYMEDGDSGTGSWHPAWNGVVPDGAVTTSKIADGAVTAAKLAPDVGEAVGSVKMFALSAPPTGWWLLDGQTIGSAVSGAVHAADDQQALFEGLWDDWPNLVVSTGRGASANADWLANKTIELPNAGSQSPMAAGTGAGLTARTLGDTLGEEAHVQTEAELADHGHPWRLTTTTQGSASAGPTGGLLSDTLHTEQNQAAWNGAPSATQGRQIGGTGNSAAANVIHPSMVFNFIIKY